MNHSPAPWRIIWIGMIVCLLAALMGLGGCSTATIKTSESAEAQYTFWQYMKEAKNDQTAPGKVQTLAGNLAAARFQSVRISPMPDTLPKVRAYGKSLNVSLFWKPADVIEDTGLDTKVKRDIKDWYKTHNLEYIRLDGPALCSSWKQEIEAAGTTERRLDRAKSDTVKSAAAAVDARNFTEADRLYLDAQKIDPDDSGLAQTYVQMQRTWVNDHWHRLADTLQKQVLPDVRQQTSVFHTKPGSTAEKTDAILAQLDATRKQLDEFRTWSQTRTIFSVTFSSLQKEYDQQQNALADLRGAAWGERLWLLAEASDFWRFYEQAKQLMLEAKDGNGIAYTAEELNTLRQHARDGYCESLPKAVAFYSLAANKSRTQRAEGLALIYWRIALELVDFGDSIRCAIPPEALTMMQTLDASMKPVRARVQDGFRRQIMIPQFESDGHDGRDVARSMETVLQKTFDPTASAQTCYGVGIARMEQGAEVKPADYLVEGKVAAIFVDAVPPVETERKEMHIGRAIAMTANDDSRTKETFPQVFSQEIWVYEKITTTYAKKCQIRADFFLSHGSGKQALWDIGDTFGQDKPLAGATLTDNAIDWRFVLIRKQQSPRKSDMLESEDLPKNAAAHLSIDRDVRQNAIDLICKGVITTLVAQVEKYPFVDLEARSASALRAGKMLDAADLYGQYLEYLYLLTAAGDEDVTTPGHHWIHAREEMIRRLITQCVPVWTLHGVQTPEQLPNVWEQAVKLAHQVEFS